MYQNSATLWGTKFAAGSVRVTPGIVVVPLRLVPLRLDHVGTTVLFLGVKNDPQDAPLARAARVPAGSFDAAPPGPFFMGVQNSPPIGKEVEPLSTWPPRLPQERRGILLAGYPAVDRLQPKPMELSWGLFTALCIARNTIRDQITWVAERSSDIKTDLPPKDTPNNN